MDEWLTNLLNKIGGEISSAELSKVEYRDIEGYDEDYYEGKIECLTNIKREVLSGKSLKGNKFNLEDVEHILGEHGIALLTDSKHSESWLDGCEWAIKDLTKWIEYNLYE